MLLLRTTAFRHHIATKRPDRVSFMSQNSHPQTSRLFDTFEAATAIPAASVTRKGTLHVGARPGSGLDIARTRSGPVSGPTIIYVEQS